MKNMIHVSRYHISFGVHVTNSDKIGASHSIVSVDSIDYIHHFSHRHHILATDVIGELEPSYPLAAHLVCDLFGGLVSTLDQLLHSANIDSTQLGCLRIFYRADCFKQQGLHQGTMQTYESKSA